MLVKVPTRIRVIFHSQKPSVLKNDLNFFENSRFQYMHLKQFFKYKHFTSQCLQ